MLIVKTTLAAMRWNGEGPNIGYPNQGGNPLWFQLPDKGDWTVLLLDVIAKLNSPLNTKELDKILIEEQ